MINKLKNEGKKFVNSNKTEDFEKAAFYYANAIKIFYYVIPEDE